MMNRGQKPEQDAFTLAELMVVIAALGVLATVSLAAVTRNTLEVQRLQCANNLRQMTVTMTLFCTDTDRGVPYEATGGGLWMSSLANYDSHFPRKIICPSTHSNAATNSSTPGAADTQWSFPYDSSGSNFVSGSYALNGWFYEGNSGLPNTTGYFQNLSFVQNPSQTPAFMDSIWVDLWPTPTDLPPQNFYTGSGLNSTGLGRLCISRHGGTDPALAPRSVNYRQFPLPGSINMTFVDGHAETVRIEKLWTFYWSSNWSVPARRPGGI